MAAVPASKANLHFTTNGKIYTVLAGFAEDRYQEKGVDVITLGFQYKEAGGDMFYKITEAKTGKIVYQQLLKNLPGGITNCKLGDDINYEALSPEQWQKEGGYTYFKDFAFKYGNAKENHEYVLTTVYTVEVGSKLQSYTQKLGFTLNAKVRMADALALEQIAD